MKLALFSPILDKYCKLWYYINYILGYLTTLSGEEMKKAMVGLVLLLQVLLLAIVSAQIIQNYRLDGLVKDISRFEGRIITGKDQAKPEEMVVTEGSNDGEPFLEGYKKEAILYYGPDGIRIWQVDSSRFNNQYYAEYLVKGNEILKTKVARVGNKIIINYYRPFLLSQNLYLVILFCVFICSIIFGANLLKRKPANK